MHRWNYVAGCFAAGGAVGAWKRSVPFGAVAALTFSKRFLMANSFANAIMILFDFQPFLLFLKEYQWKKAGPCLSIWKWKQVVYP